MLVYLFTIQGHENKIRGHENKTEVEDTEDEDEDMQQTRVVPRS